MQAVIDCRVDEKLDNDYLQLRLWGKPCYAYVIESVKNANCFQGIAVITRSEKIEKYCENNYPEVRIASELESSGDPAFIISGRAPCISSVTINSAVESYKNVDLISARMEPEYDFSPAYISFYNAAKLHKFNAFSISRGE